MNGLERSAMGILTSGAPLDLAATRQSNCLPLVRSLAQHNGNDPPSRRRERTKAAAILKSEVRGRSWIVDPSEHAETERVAYLNHSPQLTQMTWGRSRQTLACSNRAKGRRLPRRELDTANLAGRLRVNQKELARDDTGYASLIENSESTTLKF
ncbi:hypothetical protein OBBRIDRAFT_24382 [Obba rivulosa]|uniref:Uncharacterized protein n=1 Tax=Obba rivulosa TaxID=1052685 RepID=A0A8E2J577_9APHY|nr:hypothetical protein OBBRIDRAFT_24382 [Obba rivulosa]